MSTHNKCFCREIIKISAFFGALSVAMSLTVPQWGTSKEYPQKMFWWETRKISILVWLTRVLYLELWEDGQAQLGFCDYFPSASLYIA